MVVVVWDKDKYDVGVKAFNNHHKRLADIINLLHSISDSDNNINHITLVYKELLEYTKYHFSVEEKLMLKYKYENYQVQKLEHQRFIDFLLESYKKFEKDFYIIDLIELIDFLGEWIISHILDEDQKYKEFFKSKGVS